MTMRLIDKLILQAIAPPFLLAVTVLTSIVLIRELGILSELLIARNASLEVLSLITLSIMPGILIFSLPMSFLIGSLIGLTGLSGESQIVAARACGIPLRRLLRPVMGLGLAIGLATASCTIFIYPRSMDILYKLKEQISLRQATGMIQPRVFTESLPRLVFYPDDVSTDRKEWSRIFLADNLDPNAPRIVMAQSGRLITGSEGARLQIHLEKGTIYEFDAEDPSKDNVSVFATTDIPLEVEEAARKIEVIPPKPYRMRTGDLWGAGRDTSEQRLEKKVELQKRIAIPFSVIPFALLGLLLGTVTSKGGRAYGFLFSFILVVGYYLMLTVGIRLASVGEIPPWIGAWGGNIVLSVLGILLFAHGERGGWVQNVLTEWSSARHGAKRSRGQTLQDQAASATQKSGVARTLPSSPRGTRGLGFPKILDVYVSKGFCVYFLWSALVCVSLFVIMTLFDLLDDIIRNKIHLSFVFDYFLFLMPHILLIVIPMSVLLAILINFGILEKSSEVTALKAGGWSLYRIALPIFSLAGVLCLGLYFMQDYLLPYANIRQDSIRNVIKGRPPQTSMRPQRKWIFGESDRIFNYDYFDPNQNLFVALNVYEIDLENLKVRKRVHAARARIEANGTWSLENGWIRDFASGQQDFNRFERTRLFFPEKESYFKKEIFEPKESAKLTYLELSRYIDYLHKSGYNATELQVSLHKKISFPLSCFIMALVGVPFSFSMGKKGAFYGITLSIVVAIVYWGVFSIFEQMGSYGMLVPLLAAWAPNLLFGAAGLVLLLTIKT